MIRLKEEYANIEFAIRGKKTQIDGSPEHTLFGEQAPFFRPFSRSLARSLSLALCQ